MGNASSNPGQLAKPKDPVPPTIRAPDDSAAVLPRDDSDKPAVTFSLDLNASDLKPRIIPSKPEADRTRLPSSPSLVLDPPKPMSASPVKIIRTPAEDPKRSPFRSRGAKSASKNREEAAKSQTLGSVRDEGPVKIIVTPKSSSRSAHPDSESESSATPQSPVKVVVTPPGTEALNLFSENVSNEPVFMTTGPQQKDEAPPSGRNLLPILRIPSGPVISQPSGRQANSLPPINVTELMIAEPVGDEDGSRRALLIGVNYFNTPSANAGYGLCGIRLGEMSTYLRSIGYDDQVQLLEDPNAVTPTLPTRQNILDALTRLGQATKIHDYLVVYFYGLTEDGEIRAMDDRISAGMLYDNFLRHLPAGSHIRIIFDMCDELKLELPCKYIWDGPKSVTQTLSIAADIVAIGAEFPKSISYPMTQGALTWAFLQSCMEIRRSGKYTMNYNWKSILTMISLKLRQNNYDQIAALYTKTEQAKRERMDLV